MPLIPNKNNMVSSRNTRKRSKLFWIFIVVAVILCAGIVTSQLLRYQNDKAITADRARFAQADTDVQQSTEAIIVAIGQPFAINRDKSCFIRSTKYEEPLPSCSISNEMYYGVANPLEANQLYRVSQNELQKYFTRTDVSFSNTSNEGDFTELDTVFQKIYTEYKNERADMVCRATYTFYDRLRSPDIEYAVADNKYTFHLNLGCGDTAQSVLYRVRE